MSDADSEERLRALRERIDGYRLIDYKPHSSGNGGRWSDFMKFAENHAEDVGPVKCAGCGAWVPCRHCDNPEYKEAV